MVIISKISLLQYLVFHARFCRIIIFTLYALFGVDLIDDAKQSQCIKSFLFVVFMLEITRGIRWCFFLKMWNIWSMVLKLLSNIGLMIIFQLIYQFVNEWKCSSILFLIMKLDIFSYFSIQQYSDKNHTSWWIIFLCIYIDSILVSINASNLFTP